MPLRTLGVLVIMLVVQATPPAVRNGGFEEGDPSGVPAGWLVPPASAAQRSYRFVASSLPVFNPGACTGCMECVCLCPDSALLARVVEPTTITSPQLPVTRAQWHTPQQACSLRSSRPWRH